MSGRLHPYEPVSPWRYFAIVIAFATLTTVLALMVTAPSLDTHTPTGTTFPHDEGTP